jgi:hypothetical protein
LQERWILNRIWNETELGLLYTTLLANGVNRRDILVRCFDLGKWHLEDTCFAFLADLNYCPQLCADAYANYETKDDQLFYLTAQNEGRNAGIIQGRGE